jgi:hypothetical protein
MLSNEIGFIVNKNVHKKQDYSSKWVFQKLITP